VKPPGPELRLVRDRLRLDEAPAGFDNVDEGVVRCPHCSRTIWYRSMQCESCGTYFASEAWTLAPRGSASVVRTRRQAAVFLLAFILLIAALAFLLVP
jgi:hypothetical protein